MEASVELVYYSPLFSDVEVIMPFYRFLIEVEIPGTWEDIPEGSRAFIRYYVPAIHRDYLEPMTRRQVVEPPTPPTGPRALPPEIFMQLVGLSDDDWWSPRRVNRHEVAELWDEVIGEIGELAVNEAYQFRTACGRYAMITGNRMLTSRDELHRYFPTFEWELEGDISIWRPVFPGFDLPETVGDFRLREISVMDQTEDVMFIFYRPMSADVHVFEYGHSRGGPGPVEEIFVRYTGTHSIFAMYENSEGVQVGLGIAQPIMGLHFLPEDEDQDPHSVLDMGDYGQIYFQGRPGGYFRAMHEAIYNINDERFGSATVELWFINGSIDGRRHTWDLGFGPWTGHPQGEFGGTHWFTPVERDALEELVRIFNPAALAVEYRWDLMSLQ